MYAYAVSSNAPAALDIAHLAMCRGLDRKSATRVAAISSYHKFSAGQAIFFEGDLANGVYEVVSGMVKLYTLLPDGRRQVTGFSANSDFLGFPQDSVYSNSAEAVTDVVVCRYPRNRFDQLIQDVPGFAQRLLAATIESLRMAQDQMVLLGRKTALEKIASFLLSLAARQDRDDAESQVAVPMMRTDIADYLGLTAETVCRAMAKLKRDGLIHFRSPDEITIVAFDALAQLASGQGEGDM